MCFTTCFRRLPLSASILLHQPIPFPSAHTSTTATPAATIIRASIIDTALPRPFATLHPPPQPADPASSPTSPSVPLQATANLATTIIGAGIMALPRAFATLGIVLGMAMLAVIFVLSFFSLGALVRCVQGCLTEGLWRSAGVPVQQGSLWSVRALLLNGPRCRRFPTTTPTQGIPAHTPLDVS